jgi:hypothetical protein
MFRRCAAGVAVVTLGLGTGVGVAVVGQTAAGAAVFITV